MAELPTAVVSPPRRRVGVAEGHEHYKWWALSCTGLGMLLATVNSGTLIIALPDLERALGTSILQLVWVILAYMIASTVLVLTAGRLSDLFGRKHAYVGGFVLFALASLGAGFAGSGTELILWRILQGVGGAFLFANAAALVTDAFPREQLGLAMAWSSGPCSAVRSWPSRGTGCSGSTSPSASPVGCGGGWSCTSSPGATCSVATTSAARRRSWPDSPG
jgi:MFS family permease